MSQKFTYETESTGVLETYEWDRVWIEHAPDTAGKRILVIGDSISAGFYPFLNTLLGPTVHVDSFCTSKAADNPYFFPAVELFLKQESSRDAVFVSNGLHGWHLSDKAFEHHYEAFLKALCACCDAPVLLNLCTPLWAEEYRDRAETILARNEAIRRIASRLGLWVNDLHSILLGRYELYAQDRLHLNDEGSQLLANACRQALLQHRIL